jgi:hypothetical protein
LRQRLLQGKEEGYLTVGQLLDQPPFLPGTPRGATADAGLCLGKSPCRGWESHPLDGNVTSFVEGGSSCPSVADSQLGVGQRGQHVDGLTRMCGNPGQLGSASQQPSRGDRFTVSMGQPTFHHHQERHSRGGSIAQSLKHRLHSWLDLVQQASCGLDATAVKQTHRQQVSGLQANEHRHRYRR